MIAPALIAALAVLSQAEDTRPWKTVVSQEGRFVIDFPSDPTSSSSQTENGPGGRVKIIMVACETPAVGYIAEKIVMPTAVIRGSEMNMLVSYRDFFAQEFHGKVISEKKVRTDNHLGLDFTIRAQPEPGGPIGTVRIRQYLAGQAIYALIAVSADNRELPDDVGRFFGSFAEGTQRVKREGFKSDAKGAKLAGWGAVVDPDGDCKLHVEGKALVIDVPGTLHDLNADIDKYNAPRVLREVEGNFSITVKVVGDFKPGVKALNPKSVPYNGAGIFVWRDSDNFIRLERAAILRNGKPGTFVTFEEREGGSRGANHNGGLPPGTAYLRLERRGSRIFGFTSPDGKQWTQLKPIDTVWPPRLQIGLDAVNSSGDPFTVRFEELKFEGKTPAKP